MRPTRLYRLYLSFAENRSVVNAERSPFCFLPASELLVADSCTSACSPPSTSLTSLGLLPYYTLFSSLFNHPTSSCILLLIPSFSSSCRSDTLLCSTDRLVMANAPAAMSKQAATRDIKAQNKKRNLEFRAQHGLVVAFFLLILYAGAPEAG